MVQIKTLAITFYVSVNLQRFNQSQLSILHMSSLCVIIDITKKREKEMILAEEWGGAGKG